MSRGADQMQKFMRANGSVETCFLLNEHNLFHTCGMDASDRYAHSSWQSPERINDKKFTVYASKSLSSNLMQTDAIYAKYHTHGISATQPDQGYFGNPAMKFRRLSNQAAGVGGDGNRIRLKHVWTTEVFMQFPIPSSVRG